MPLLKKELNPMDDVKTNHAALRGSQVRKFILVLELSDPLRAQPIINDQIMAKVGVPVRSLHCRADGLVLLTTTDSVRFRGNELLKRLVGGDCCKEFYNGLAPEDGQLRVRTVLTASGETKEEFKRLEQLFAAEDNSAMAKRPRPCEMNTRVEAKFSMVQTESGNQLADAQALSCRLTVEVAALKTEASALKEENEALRKENAHWMAEKAAFDRLTLSYAEWRFDLKVKEEEISRLKEGNRALEKELALMTQRRDNLVKRAM